MSKETVTEENEINLEETFNRTEQFIEDNKKNLSIGLGILILLIGGYFAYKKLIIEPQNQEALSQMFIAEKYFEMDSLNLAINGDGQYLGFDAITDKYSGTQSGNLAHYYLGMCYLKKGDYEKAIANLKSFDSNDDVVGTLATGGIGDAYMELDKADEASGYYRKAANRKKNNFITPLFLLKAGMAYEESGKYNDALNIYEEIKRDYSQSNEGRNIDKYIAKAKAEL